MHIVQHETKGIIPTFTSEPVPEENLWTLWCKGRLIEADTPTIRLGVTPSGLTGDHLHHPPIFFTGWTPFPLPNQQCQSMTYSVICNHNVLAIRLSEMIQACYRKCSLTTSPKVTPNDRWEE